ncbi:MAG: protoporphyrinogen oxidase HemJ [Parvularculaceae bacterium]
MFDFLLPAYPWIKGVHVIAVIAWMAGMLYLPRLFVYHHQAAQGGEAEAAFVAMERRLYKLIMTPSIVAVWLLALLMLAINPGVAASGWFALKFLLVLGVSGVHGFYGAARRRFEAGERPRTEKFWRIMNEVPFVLMAGAVLLAVAKPF